MKRYYYIPITTDEASNYFTITNGTYYFAPVTSGCDSGYGFKSNNKGKSSTTATSTFKLKALPGIKNGCTVSSATLIVSYIGCGESSYDYLIGKKDGTTFWNKIAGGTTVQSGSYTINYVAGTTLEFSYRKDGSTHKGEDGFNISFIVQYWLEEPDGCVQVDSNSSTPKYIYDGYISGTKKISCGRLDYLGVWHLNTILKTDIQVGRDTTTEIKFQYTELAKGSSGNGGGWMAMAEGNSRYYVMQYRANSSGTWGLYSMDANNTAKQMTYEPDMMVHTITYNRYNSDSSHSTIGEPNENSSANYNYSFNLDANTGSNYGKLQFFGASFNGGEYASGRIFYCKIYDKGVLTHHLIPFQWGSSQGLFDIITKKYYTNAALGYDTNTCPSTDFMYLDAIQSSGNQYIDTGLSLPNGWMADIEYEFFKMPSASNYSECILGAQGPSSDYCQNYIRYNISSKKWELANTFAQPQDIILGKRYKMRVEILKENSNIKKLLKIDGETIINATSTSANLTSNNLYLFANNGNNSEGIQFANSIKLYSCKIYNEKGTLVRNYVPAANGCRHGLYDEVNKKMYYNYLSGTDNWGTEFIGFSESKGNIVPKIVNGFINEPAKAEEIEYIISEKTSFINTNFKPNNDTRIIMDMQILRWATGRWPSPFGTWGANSISGKSLFGVEAVNAANTYTVHYGSSEAASIADSFLTKRATHDLNKNTYTVVASDNTTVTKTLTANTFQSYYPIYIGKGGSYYGTTTAGGARVKIYSCKIYNNGTLIRDLVPIKITRVTGIEYAMYDKINKKYYYNQGDAAFSGGGTVKGEITDATDKIYTPIVNRTWEVHHASVCPVNGYSNDYGDWKIWSDGAFDPAKAFDGNTTTSYNSLGKPPKTSTTYTLCYIHCPSGVTVKPYSMEFSRAYVGTTTLLGYNPETQQWKTFGTFSANTSSSCATQTLYLYETEQNYYSAFRLLGQGASAGVAMKIYNIKLSGRVRRTF